MRTAQTPAEARLWRALRAGRLNGLKVRRQVPIGPFIIDFVVPASKVVIELDGGQHSENAAYDDRRTKWLEREGYRVLRFWNVAVFEDLDGVLNTILSAATPLSPLGPGRELPSPLKGEGL